MAAKYKLLIKDMGWNRIIKDTKKITNSKIKAGLWGGQAQKGARHEYGTKHIPERPFMTNAMVGNENKINDMADKLLTAVYFFGMTPGNFVKKIAVFHVGQIKESIRNGNYTPLSPKTTARKGSTKPLIDTAQMINSVKSEIVRR